MLGIFEAGEPRGFLQLLLVPTHRFCSIRQLVMFRSLGDKELAIISTSFHMKWSHQEKPNISGSDGQTGFLALLMSG